MSLTLHLPPHFLTTASYWHQLKNPYRNRVEVGGFLVANPAAPDVVKFATGPGKAATHAYAELELDRHDVQAAVEAAGYIVCGDWHVHPFGVQPSETDKRAWLLNLKDSTLTKWHSIILVRDDKRWTEKSAWSTYARDGNYYVGKPDVTPELTDARDLARELTWIVSRSSLLDQAAGLDQRPVPLAPRPDRP